MGRRNLELITMKQFSVKYFLLGGFQSFIEKKYGRSVLIFAFEDGISKKLITSIINEIVTLQLIVVTLFLFIIYRMILGLFIKEYEKKWDRI